MKKHFNLLKITVGMLFISPFSHAETNQNTVSINNIESEYARNLKAFNENLNIRFLNKEIKQAQNGDYVVVITYEIENKGKKSIRGVNWLTIFSYRGQQLHSQYAPFDLGKDSPLLAGKKRTVQLEIPEEKLTAPNWLTLTYPYFNVKAVNEPKEIIFTDKTGIIIK